MCPTQARTTPFFILNMRIRYRLARAHGTASPRERLDLQIETVRHHKSYTRQASREKLSGVGLGWGVQVVCKVWGAEALSMARRRAVVCRSGSMTALYSRGLCRSQAVPDHRMGAARQFRVTVEGSLARPTARLLAAWWWPYGRPMVALWSPGATRRAGYSGGGMPSSSMKARKNPAWL